MLDILGSQEIFLCFFSERNGFIIVKLSNWKINNYYKHYDEENIFISRKNEGFYIKK